MRTRARREAEFSDYVVRRRHHLYRTAWLVCGDPHLAEDLVQQTLTKLYVSWHRLREEGAVDAYARRILVNAHLDEVRRPFRRREQSAPDDQLDRAGRVDLPYEELDDLGSALRALAPGQRAVVVLRHYWGLSVNETADTLGIRAHLTTTSSARCATWRRVPASRQRRWPTTCDADAVDSGYAAPAPRSGPAWPRPRSRSRSSSARPRCSRSRAPPWPPGPRGPSHRPATAAV